MNLKKIFASSVIAAGSVARAQGAVAAEQTYVTIGTGGQTGVYYVVGASHRS